MAAHRIFRVIPKTQRARARRWYQVFKKKAHLLALTLTARSHVAEGLYYTFFNHDFSRETAAVGAGQSRYARDLLIEAQSSFLLRRNTHRLEKGLIMRPRRPSFAADYILETVDAYRRVVAGMSGCGETGTEVKWARDVLNEYFSVVDKEEPTICRAYSEFRAIGPAADANADDIISIPYRRNLDVPPPVDFQSFMELCIRRRSVRWYADKPVPRDLIDRAMEAATQSPSACNRQPFTFRIFDNPDMVRKIAAIPLGTKGFGDALPAIAVIVGRLRAYPMARDRHAIYVDGALAAMSFMFALETIGLASCPINWADQEPQESMMRKALKLEDDERVILLVGFGWPDPSGMVPFSAKRPLDQIRSYN